MGQLGLLVSKGRHLAGLHVRRLDLADLIPKEVAIAFPLALVSVEGAEGPLGLPKGGVRRTVSFAQVDVRRPRESVEQRGLRGRQQGSGSLVLPVDLHQPLTDGCERGEGGKPPVDPRGAPTVHGDRPGQHDLHVRTGSRLLALVLQDLDLRRHRWGEAEPRLDGGGPFTRSNRGGRAPCAA